MSTPKQFNQRIIEEFRARGVKVERDGLWRLQTEEIPVFADYEQKTEREIPVVILERAA